MDGYEETGAGNAGLNVGRQDWTTAVSDTHLDVYKRQLEHNEGSKMASPLFMMVDSGARGNKAQIKQLSGCLLYTSRCV